ncbi:glycosyltransferase family 2 protein [Paenarthrobacter nicotinovorans]|uniref:Glycosyltransferase family 2 protein n=1 Tax=Paenarthrobacter nicotinovorans TaxID=29320 RepID=A0ABV0GU35_PAENI|nr:glycosyltransferase family 2 protein [Paenarthrobacter nicotinovorans]
MLAEITEVRELAEQTSGTDSLATATAPRGSRRAAGGVVTVLVPAHNESAGITETLTSLNNQTRRPDRIIVVADNCTDDTETLALAQGVEVMRTVGNKDKKAGALNFALSELLPYADPEDLFLVQDADSQLALNFIENATKNLLTDELLGAVGGVFSGGPGGGFVGHLQRNEYARYARDVKRLHGKCLVVTGTAALFRVKTLRDVVSARLEGTLPPGNGKGGVYDTSVLTEDNELSFALLTLGYRIASPSNCTLVTEVMPTWRELWAQRLRWKRGAVENCVQYGWTKITRPYWGRQFLSMIGVVVTLAYFGSIIFALTTGMGLNLHPFWIAVTAIFVLERIVTLRFRGWRYMLLAATMYETVIDIFLQAVHAKAYLDAALNRKKVW